MAEARRQRLHVPPRPRLPVGYGVKEFCLNVKAFDCLACAMFSGTEVIGFQAHARSHAYVHARHMLGHMLMFL